MHPWLSRLKWRYRSPPHPLLPLGDPRLRTPAAQVPGNARPCTAKTIRSLADALHWFQARHGAARGIAAPQIGIPFRIILVERDGKEVPLINPVITWTSPESRFGWERCMSFPHLAVCVPRPVSLSVTFLTAESTRDTWEYVGPDLASLVRHEVDHLDGVLTLDRAEAWEMVVPWTRLVAEPNRFHPHPRGASAGSPQEPETHSGRS